MEQEEEKEWLSENEDIIHPKEDSKKEEEKPTEEKKDTEEEGQLEEMYEEGVDSLEEIPEGQDSKYGL